MNSCQITYIYGLYEIGKDQVYEEWIDWYDWLGN